MVGRHAAQPEAGQAESSDEKAQNFHVSSQMRAQAVRQITTGQMRRMQGNATLL